MLLPGVPAGLLFLLLGFEMDGKEEGSEEDVGFGGIPIVVFGIIIII